MVLLVYPDERVLNILRSHVSLCRPNSRVVHTADALQALALMEQETEPVDICFTGIEMPGATGLRIARELRALNRAVKIIFVDRSSSFALEAVRAHIDNYLAEPVTLDKVRGILDAYYPAPAYTPRPQAAPPAEHKLPEEQPAPAAKEPDMRRLSRAELIDVIYQLKKSEQALQAQVKSLQEQLQDKRLRIGNVGSIADAALALSDVFCSAQEAADLYLDEIRLRRESAEQECIRMTAKAQLEADRIIQDALRQKEQIENQCHKANSELRRVQDVLQSLHMDLPFGD